ncbi:diguanylate cyclase/phosphodiesterase with PAS/PAC sensor(s) [Leptothrix cholodnii SP-6]|uniref:Diguanylate cyclase/phosphodiesterase with PAS/PAC sensor(S) n=1 Tax=Leptothrix cholodnii (strain ATCC 51168 / LMG 8142 / SP-6) TaxID=395495 RepID=B1Y659_LEPCP|nr:EAL domain-containing protein [Leptothrix cholodnii]ACB33564.1 diguanylate cyclase/phosphodiesterase with PAS/PAC sensor(s) [Leptothrix cholodnii SP-6]
MASTPTTQAPDLGDFFKSVIDSTTDAVITKDLHGIVTSWNRAAESIFGYSAAEMIGQPMVKVFPADRLQEEPMILARIGRGERVDHFETVRVRKDGSLVNVSATISPLHDSEGRIVGASKIARDITERIQAERTIWLQANHDTLTSLPNRRHFQERLTLELARARRMQRHLAVMFIDLDRFKDVNDTLGHQAGDDLLVQAAQRIRAAVREIDTVARMGGDEFTILLPDLVAGDEVEPIARRVNLCLFKPFTLDGQTSVQISGSIGVALFPQDGETADVLLMHADQAMYESKRLGRNQARHFAKALESNIRDRMRLTHDLRHAVERGELSLSLQPLVDLRDGSVRQHEALLRWVHPVFGAISPSVFMPLAEETGVIRDIGDWAFDTVARQAADRSRAGSPVIPVSLDVSPVQLHAGLGYFRRWLDEWARLELPADALALEIAESALAEPSDGVGELLQQLGAAGVPLIVDHFGAGASCLSRLNRLDIGMLKLDPSLLRDLGVDGKSTRLCEAMVQMAHTLGLQVVAQGVETPAQRALLARMGCDFGQGHLFAAIEPGPGAEVPAWPAAA